MGGEISNILLPNIEGLVINNSLQVNLCLDCHKIIDLDSQALFQIAQQSNL